MNNRGWVQGDGGPLIVLQTSAAAHWQGAKEFDNSIMNGGSIETDYDVICECVEEVCLMRRYDRDMLVLSDSEWQGRMFASPSGQITVVQSLYQDEEFPDITEWADQSEPSRSFSFAVEDAALRLIVGAGDGEGSTYGRVDTPITPGAKRCDVYTFNDGIVVTIGTHGEESIRDNLTTE